jgi:hypothetical protein
MSASSFTSCFAVSDAAKQRLELVYPISQFLHFFTPREPIVL